MASPSPGAFSATIEHFPAETAADITVVPDIFFSQTMKRATLKSLLLNEWACPSTFSTYVFLLKERRQPA